MRDTNEGREQARERKQETRYKIQVLQFLYPKIFMETGDLCLQNLKQNLKLNIYCHYYCRKVDFGLNVLSFLSLGVVKGQGVRVLYSLVLFCMGLVLYGVVLCSAVSCLVWLVPAGICVVFYFVMLLCAVLFIGLSRLDLHFIARFVFLSFLLHCFVFFLFRFVLLCLVESCHVSSCFVFSFLVFVVSFLAFVTFCLVWSCTLSSLRQLNLRVN